MTSTPPPFDELVSAYLDGEVTADEVALVEASAELMGEVRRLEALTGPIADTTAVPPPPAGQRQAHLAAALAAFDTGAGADQSRPTAVAEQPQVVSLDERRKRPSVFNGRALGIAAAIAFLVLGAAALFSFNNSSSNGFETADTTTAASESVADSVADTASDASDDAGDAMEESEAGFAAPGDSGAETDLRAADDETLEEEAYEEEAAATEAMADDDAMADDAMAEESPAEAALPEATPPASEPNAGSDDAEGSTDEQASGSIEDFWIGSTTIEELPELLATRPSAPASRQRTRCQLEHDQLDNNATPTLIAVATVDAVLVEIHELPGANAALLLDGETCEIIAEVAIP